MKLLTSKGSDSPRFSQQLLFLFFIVCFVFLPNLNFAKDGNSFSRDRDIFIKELEAFMKKSNNQVITETFNSFERYFNRGSFTEAEVATIISVSNKMLEQRITPNPVFKDYLTSLLFIKEGNNEKHLFDEWHQILTEVLTNDFRKKTKQFKNYVDFSSTLFSDGAFVSGQKGHAWLLKDGSFHLGNSDGKFFVFVESGHLVKIQKNKELTIKSTSGYYYPTTKTWKGTGGTIAWNTPGASGIDCSLEKYAIQLKGNLIKIDTVFLQYDKLYPNKKIAGSFETKIGTSKSIQKTYPRFTSHDCNLTLDQLNDRVQLTGGLKLKGTKILTYGTALQPAELIISDPEQNRALKAQGLQFTLIDNAHIAASGVAVDLFLQKDALTHPSANLRYDLSSAVLELSIGNLPENKAPFFASYQGVNIYSDKISWTIGADYLEINEKNPRIGNGNKKVVFESKDFFNIQTYRKLQNVADKNPIATLKLLRDKTKADTINANTFARALNKNFSTDNIRALLYEMVASGFILFQPKTETITIKERLVHFANAAQSLQDYDLIRFYSDSDKTNAKIDIKSNHMMVDAVSTIEFSDRQKVAAKPYKKQLLLKEDRNLSFDGKLFAGYSSFEGKDFNFEYKPNQLVLDSIRYFDLFTITNIKDGKGGFKAESIASRIEHVNGVLLIDAPENKSGKEDIALFPSFNSKGKSYLFYDSKETQKGTYSRDSFFVALDEFHLNGLDELLPEDLNFKGSLVSAGILPEIPETVRLQEDGSLGMKVSSPTEGYPAYGGKGNLQGDVSLDNKGFTAKGTINYHGATLESDDIVLKPKQLLSTAQKFELEESEAVGKEKPQVFGEDVAINWQPYKDSMYISVKEKGFKIFKDGNYTLRDLLILTPGGLKGRGIFDWDKGQLKSELYSFGAHHIESDTTNLTIKAEGLDHLALDTKNVYTKLNFKNNVGTVRANSDSVYTELPYNTYITSLNEFDWDMKNETITFKADKDGRGSFKSTNEEHDGLTFWGKEAFYDLKTYELKLGGVSKIETADAFVVPDSGQIEIHKLGAMKTLTNATIIADTANQYHIIRRATVEILGRKEYRASGFYEYNLGDRNQEFTLTEIIGQPIGKGRKKKRKCLTSAVGVITAGQEFYIDEKIKFSGDIGLVASRASLDFSGFAYLAADKLPKTEWFSVNSLGDKLDLKLSYNEPENKSGEILRTGLVIQNATGKLYPVTMSAKKQESDYLLFEAKGLLDHDPTVDAFYFGDSLKIVSGVRSGNVLTYNNEKGKLKAEGKFNFFNEEDALVATVAGMTEFDHYNDQEKTPEKIFELMLGFDLFLPSKLMKIIETDLVANAYNSRNIDYMKNREFYQTALSEFIPEGKELATARARMLNLGLEVPEKYNFPILLADIKMTWDKNRSALVAKKGKIGIAGFNGIPINKKMEGELEFRILPDGTKRFTFQLVIPGDINKYFFEYQDGMLLTTSTNPAYNETVENLKKRDRFVKTKKGQTLEIGLANDAKIK